MLLITIGRLRGGGASAVDHNAAGVLPLIIAAGGAYISFRNQGFVDVRSYIAADHMAGGYEP